MTREIKFRAWDKKRNEYLSGGQVLIAVMPGRCPEHNQIYLDVFQNADVHKDRFVLEQFTGLQDINEREIYENDILRLITSFGEERLFVVKFGTIERSLDPLDGFEKTHPTVSITGFYFEWEGQFTLFPSVYDGKPDNERMEVIGNIHEQKGA